MEQKNQMLQQLESFKRKQKFSDLEWNNRGLNPSEKAMCQQLENLFNANADKLIRTINSNAIVSEGGKMFKPIISSFKRWDYDTEEAEFICDYLHELSQIIGVDINDDINTWLYDKGISELIKSIQPKKVIEAISQDCTECHSQLETFILMKGEGPPDYSAIVKCDNCSEYNLLALGSGIKEMRFGNYLSIESFPTNKYNQQQIKDRIKELKIKRNK